ncbi:translation machinery-associated protein 22 isoform X2 [Physcomitrium patens]|uniref:Translation machinery-associated protein 22 n=1 Tax=Physcomitrium patens TaxID=3218 RepID=A9SZ98_PHYPA|nr:translation machinery-associated protein 22-like isoform X2 [Physcomitrium patens]PNR46669.1 hypothetical protein PHYPA_013789 [Physcomitrium patens]|eukprot:XP_024386007.1 translation machinery-associated protein 22-like isoform X2 [Physcomitrella patens]
MAVKLQPVQVLYCPVCSMPAEYCEFSPEFEKCKSWLIKNAPDLYPQLVQEAADKAAEKLDGLTVGGEEDGVKGEGSSSEPKKEDEVKRLPGGKVKKKEKPEVVVEKIVRNKRKCVTIIKGLDMFGIKLSEASKKLGKKFASGASVVKGPTDKEQIDVQGDIMYDIVEFITDTWKSVPESAIYFIEDGRKVSANA